MSLEYLSDHFRLDEFVRTSYGLKLMPQPHVTKNLELLCRVLLEPIRQRFEKPVVITSGYRSKKLNKKVGGQPYSLHLIGRAADFVIRHNPYNFWESTKRLQGLGKLICYPQEKRWHIEVGAPRVLIKSTAYEDITELF